MAKQTLKQAIHLAATRKSRSMVRALWALDGKPVGSWGETVQARGEIADSLLLRDNRDYTLDQFIDAAYEDVGGMYRTRQEFRPHTHWLVMSGDTEHYGWVESVHTFEDAAINSSGRGCFIHELPAGSDVPAVGDRIRYC